MPSANRASIEFSLNWQSQYANHRDRYFASKVDFWRDIFPGTMEQSTKALHEGESYSESFDIGVLVPQHENGKIFNFKENAFERTHAGRTITPFIGRFYPQVLAWEALNSFKENFTPFRIVNMNDGVMVADTNHPLAKFPLTLEAKYIEKLGARQEHGGACNDIAELVTNSGPGMQVPDSGVSTDFYSTYPFKRANEESDANFYLIPRMINHLDNIAIKQVKSIYSRLLSPGIKILDLMSSWTSHLPETLSYCEVTGLGMNKEELQKNQQLSNFVVHDLNRNPVLPFKNNEFDAVICTASIEYLTQPIEVMTEVARVTKPGGIFITTFSDRWFPGKEILPWADMHNFERLGFVLDLYMKSGEFQHLHTESIRGLPRSLNDPHIAEKRLSDPIFAVWGSKKG